jgi:hypothetical protein
VDGVLGPISIAQINALDPVKLLAEFKAAGGATVPADRGEQRAVGRRSGRLAGALEFVGRPYTTSKIKHFR